MVNTNIPDSKPSLTHTILQLSPKGVAVWCPLCLSAPLGTHTVTTEHHLCLLKSRVNKPMVYNPIIGKYLYRHPWLDIVVFSICDNSFSCFSARRNQWTEPISHHSAKRYYGFNKAAHHHRYLNAFSGGQETQTPGTESVPLWEDAGGDRSPGPSLHQVRKPSGQFSNYTGEREPNPNLPVWVNARIEHTSFLLYIT